MKRYRILVVAAAVLGVAHAGHEFPFYPSFDPQEITVEALDAQTAAQRLAKGTLHAYAGGDLADSEKSGSFLKGPCQALQLEPRREPEAGD